MIESFETYSKQGNLYVSYGSGAQFFPGTFCVCDKRHNDETTCSYIIQTKAIVGETCHWAFSYILASSEIREISC